MTRALACPDSHDLERLARGQLSAPEAEPLGQHILGCASCAQLLNSLQSGDTLLTELQAALGQQPASNPLVDALIDRFVRRPPDSPGLTAPSGPATLLSDTPARGVSPPERVPGFEILGELGRGGMGVVYKARQVALNRLVAIKMILAGGHAGAEEVARFRAEAEAVAQLRHPHIVQIHEVGEAGGKPFFALEFIEGGSLAGLIQGAPLAARPAAELVQTLARAMHHAHEHDIIHRDLKPANVLVTTDGTPKITDFGLAKRLETDAGRTPSGAILGTPSYMAPEMAAGKTQEIGPAVDTYALGAILYEVVTCRPPFRAETALETLQLVLAEEPVPPRRLQPKLPPDLETICLKCLEKDRHQRYATAEALADDLRRFLNGEPIRARPTSNLERLRKWCRRKPAAAALAGVTLLAAFAFLACIALYALYQSQQASIYQQKLKQAREQEKVRARSGQTLLRAQRHEAAGHWTAAQTELEKAREALAALPDLRADELRAEVRRRLTVVRQRLRQQQQRQQAQKRRQDFQVPYDDALFYATLFTGLDLAESRAKTRRAIRTALAIYGLDREARRADRTLTLLERDRPHHRATEQARLAEACYELLLIWAEIEAIPLPGQGETVAQRRRQARKALTLLARAARLSRVYRLKTRTYNLRKAHYLARSKGEPFAPRRIDATAASKPSSALDWFLKGLEQYRAGQFTEASKSSREVLLKQPNHFWARYVLALCQLRAGQWVDGKAELTVCINLRPEFVWPRLLRGFAASELGFKHADPQLAAAEFRLAAADFDLALKRDRGPLVQYVGLANRGVLNIGQQHWAEAVADLRQAVQVNPAGFQGYVNLAQALQGQGKAPEALAALDQAVKRRPDLAVLYESRARLHLRHKQWAAARADFAQAIARELKDSKSDRLVNNLVELGRLRQRERQYAAALACYDRALKLKPELVLAERFRAEALLALDRPAAAGQALDRYLAVTRAVPVEVYRARGLIHAAMKQLPAAIEMYTLALRQDPADRVTRCHRGWAYLLNDAVRLALADFEVCLRQDPTNTDALTGRGNACILLKQLAGALDDARAAENQGSLTDRQLYNLACIYAQAAGQQEAELRTARPDRARPAAQRLALYQDKALDLLRQTLAKLPEQRRAAFWRRQVQADPALKAVRRGRRYFQMTARYAGTGGAEQ